MFKRLDHNKNLPSVMQVDMGECEGVCQPPGLPCHGSCMAAQVCRDWRALVHSALCIVYLQCLAGSECLSLAEDGQVVRGSCRGHCQDRWAVKSGGQSHLVGSHIRWAVKSGGQSLLMGFHFW